MPLSEYEQRVIDDLERSLLRDDPKLAHAFRTNAPRASSRVIGVAVGVLLGIGALVLGAVMENSLIVALGFGAIFLSLAWAASRRKSRTEVAEADYGYVNLTPKEFAASNTNASNSRFMDKLEDRWNRRQGELREQ